MTEWRTVERPSTLSVEPRAQVEGDIPDVHVIAVRERRVTVDYPTIIQHNVNTDTIELDLDGEWDGMSVVLVLGPCGGATELAWHGEPLTLPSALAEDTGGIDVSVVGYSADGDTRLVTVAAPSLLNVIKSGCTVGEAPGDETPDLIGQLVAAGDAANKAAQSANAAATSANKAAGAANTAASAANTAAGKANDAATKATDAATEATDAAGDATRAAQSANAAAEAAGAAAEAARGNVLKGTLGPAHVLSADDAYATKPRRLTVYGATRQNLWVNPSGTQNGVTVTSNADGSFTLSGTASSQSIVRKTSYALVPGKSYCLSIDSNITEDAPSGTAYTEVDVVFYSSSDKWLASARIGYGSVLSATFLVPADAAYSLFRIVVKSGDTVSGTYRVMLNEGSTAEPWCPPGLNGVDELSIVTAGKNLAGIVSNRLSSAIAMPVKAGQLLVASLTTDQPITDVYNRTIYIHNGVTGEYLNRRMDFSATDTGRLQSSVWTCQESNMYKFIMYGKNATDLQLELGSTASAYEPPNVTTTPIDLDGHTLNSLPNGTCDELRIDGTGAVTLVQRVGAKVLPSDAESWRKDPGGSDARYMTGISPDAVDNYVPGTVMSDALPPRNATENAYSSTCIIAVWKNAYASIGSGETAQTIASVCGGKTLLYPLAAPEIITLPSVTLPTLPSPNITVYHDSDIPSDIAVEYERDVTIAFDKLAKQIAGTASAVAVREASTIEEE